MNSFRSGHFAETAARWFLRLKGYVFVTANYVTGRGTGAGEIDLIMRRGNTLVFVEVKKRATTEQGAYALKPAQQRRIRRAAEAFVARRPQYQKYNLRFDVVLFCPPFGLRHLKNAF